MTRIAVCFFGQPRTFKYCIPILRRVYERPGIQVDYFIHTWTVDSFGTGCGEIEKIHQKDELRAELVELCHPKDLLIENPLEVGDFELDDVQYDTNCVMYSLSKTLTLRRCYEKSNKFRYDYVIASRLDLSVSGLDEPYRGLNYDLTKKDQIKDCYEIACLGHPCPIESNDTPEGGMYTLYDLAYLMKSKTADELMHVFSWSILGGGMSISNSFRSTNSMQVRHITGDKVSVGPDILIFRYFLFAGLYASCVLLSDCMFPVRISINDFNLDPKNLLHRDIVNYIFQGAEYECGYKPYPRDIRKDEEAIKRLLAGESKEEVRKLFSYWK